MQQKSPEELSFVPFDVEKGREEYLACYADAWRCAHGSLEGFDGEALWRAALWRSIKQPRALLSARRDGALAGLLALDESRERSRGVCWVSFCYVMPELRGQGLGRALLEQAAQRGAELGRRRLRLCVAPGNSALAFYRHLGFAEAGREPGAVEELLVLEKEI